MTIDWDGLLVDWNSVRNKPFYRRLLDCDNPPKFDSVKEMLSWLYDRTKSTNVMSRILGPSTFAILPKLREYGIMPDGSPNQKKGMLYGKNIEGMTAKEVSEKYGCSPTWAHAFAQKYGIKLKKRR
jgi:hypothetical protein